MRSGFCPACYQPVSLPDLAPETLVRCPLCRAEHRLAEFARAVPPTVEVVAEGAVDSAGDPVASRSSATRPIDREGRAEGADIVQTAQDARPGARPLPPDFSERLPSPAEMAPLILTAGKHAPQRRRGLGGALKVVVGGLLGAVLAQLMVWWLPHPYRTDPLELAPRLPDRLKWIAPLELQWGGRIELAADPAGQSWELGRDESQNASSQRELVVGPKLELRFNGVEIEGAVRDAQAATARLNGPPEARTVAQFDAWSRSLDLLAYRLAAADPQDRDVESQRAAAVKLIRAIGDQPELKATFERHQRGLWQRLASGSSGSPSDGTAGLVVHGGWVSGRVESIGPRGAYFESLVRVSAEATSVSVLSLVDPSLGVSPEFRVGDLVTVGGLIVSRPAAELAGYDGPDRPALWVGITIPSSPAAAPPGR